MPYTHAPMDDSMTDASTASPPPSRSPSDRSSSDGSDASSVDVPRFQPRSIRDGRVVGEWSLGEKIGEGSYATVRRAHHTDSGRAVAVKVVQKRDLDANEHEQIRREIDILNHVSHLNVIQCLDALESSTAYYIVMELCENGDLFDLLQQSRLPENDARRLFQQSIDAVDHLHHAQLCHCDIKPENLALDNNGDVKLVDFGMAVPFVEGTQHTDPCASLYFASPQVATGQPYDPVANDVWALGVVLYCFLAGRRPFEHRSERVLADLIRRGAYNIPSHFPADAVHLIRRMLVVDERDRATMDEIKRHPWLNASYEEMTAGRSHVAAYVQEKARRRSTSRHSAPRRAVYRRY